LIKRLDNALQPKRFDISDQVLRVLNRTEKREQLTKKNSKEAEEREKAKKMH
jgi:hypothetical protein